MASTKRKPQPIRKSPVKRVCVLTGGGDAPGLNAVIRAFVRTSTALNIEVLGSRDGFASLIGNAPLEKLDRSRVRGILPKGGTILGTSNRGSPFAGLHDGDRAAKRRAQKLIKRLEAERIDRLVMIGGDGTLGIGQSLSELGVPVVGVPKTIDNDLRATDQTFGLDTAVTHATWAIDTLHSTAEAHQRVLVLEVMGRHAGWIALHAGIAGGADAVLMPEFPYQAQRVAKCIKARAKAGSNFSIIVIGEGAYPKHGSQSHAASGVGGSATRLGGAGNRLVEELSNRVPHEVRLVVLGHLQRGGSPTARDRVLASRFGIRAAYLCREGAQNVMVALRGDDVVAVSLEEATSGIKQVSADDDLIRSASALGIELGFDARP